MAFESESNSLPPSNADGFADIEVTDVVFASSSGSISQIWATTGFSNAHHEYYGTLYDYGPGVTGVDVYMVSPVMFSKNITVTSGTLSVTIEPAGVNNSNSAQKSFYKKKSPGDLSDPKIYDTVHSGLSYRIDGGELIPFADSTGAAVSIPAPWGFHTIEVFNGDPEEGDFFCRWFQYYANLQPIQALTATHIYDTSGDEADFGAVLLDAGASSDPDGGALLYQYTVNGTDTFQTSEAQFVYYVREEWQSGPIEFRLHCQDDEDLRHFDGLVTVTRIVTFVAPLQQIGATLPPTGALLTAQNVVVGTSRSVVVSRFAQPGAAPTTLYTLANAENPSLMALINGGHPSGKFALMARVAVSGVKAWRLYISADSARSFSLVATVFSSTSISYAHAVAIPGNGAVAVAVVKGATLADNKLVFKRTADFASWPTDANAVVVQTGIANAPVHVLVSATGANTLFITDGKTIWLTSKDGGRTWS